MSESHQFQEDNLQLWDERVDIHLQTDFYGMDAFRKGDNSLHHIETELLGDVQGKRVLHLQCHFGQDTLSLARMGADVTGVDFSPTAIQRARELADELRLSARFIESDVLELPSKLDETFDIVFTSYGVLKWLCDIDRWGEVVANHLAANGRVVLVEFHPYLYVFDYDRAEEITHSYFVGKDPISYDEVGTYADIGASGAQPQQRAHSWPHPTSRVISALMSAGLLLEHFAEYPYSTIDCFPFTTESSPGRYVHREHPQKVPMLYSVVARRPEHR